MKPGDLVKVGWGFTAGAYQIARVVEVGAYLTRFQGKVKIRKWRDARRCWTTTATWVPIGYVSTDLSDRRPAVLARARSTPFEATR